MIHQRIDKPFGEDEDANHAVREMASRVAEYALGTRDLARRQFPSLQDRLTYRSAVIAKGDLIQSRARKALVAETDMPAFFDAAAAYASAKLGRKIEIFPIAEAEVPAYDPQQRELDAAVMTVEDILERAEEQLKRATTRVANLKRDLAEKKTAADAHRDAKRAGA